MSACYLDASALVKLATQEDESQALRDAIAGYGARITSRLTEVEVAGALARRSPASAALIDGVRLAFEALAIVELDRDVASVAGSLSPPNLRSLDAIHLASALSLGEELAMFITYDKRLADAAAAAGLEVVAPTP